MQTKQNKNLWKETPETINWQPGLGMGPRMTQTENNLPAMRENWVEWEDSLEEGMATHSSTLAWRTPWTGEPGRVQGGHRESDMTVRLSTVQSAGQMRAG